MHRSGMMVAAALTMASPGIASATAYTFSEAEISALGSETFTFSLDTATAGNSSGGASFSNITITANGRPSAGQTVTASFTTNLSSGSLFFLVDTSTTPFYTGTGTGITFNTGTFAIADGLTDGEGTLTVAAAAPVPEPATWAVLLGGLAVATAAGIARRARWSLGSGGAAAA